MERSANDRNVGVKSKISEGRHLDSRLVQEDFNDKNFLTQDRRASKKFVIIYR